MNGKRPKLDGKTQAAVFALIDATRKKYGALALPAIRKYLTQFKERDRREQAIARLRRELAELEKKS